MYLLPYCILHIFVYYLTLYNVDVKTGEKICVAESKSFLPIFKAQNICLVPDKDGYDIKKQEEVLQESLMMVPDCQRRLAKAFTELKQILETEQDLKEVEDYIEAEKVLHEAEEQLPKEGNILEMC